MCSCSVVQESMWWNGNQIRDRAPPPPKSGFQTLHTWNNPGGRWSGGGTGGGNGGPGLCGADETGAHQGGADETGAHQGGADETGAHQGGAETHSRDWDLEETETQETERAHIVSRTEVGSFLGGHS